QLVTAVEKALQPAAVALWALTASSRSGLRATSVADADANSATDSRTTQLRWVASNPESNPPPSVGAALILRGHDPARAELLLPMNAVDVDRLPLTSPAFSVLRAAEMRLVLPLVSQGELEGLLALAPHPGARIYGEGDDLREALAALAAAV